MGGGTAIAAGAHRGARRMPARDRGRFRCRRRVGARPPLPRWERPTRGKAASGSWGKRRTRRRSVAVNLFAFGLGYSALHFIRGYRRRFERVAGTVTSPEKVQALGVEPYLFDGSHADPEIAS